MAMRISAGFFCSAFRRLRVCQTAGTVLSSMVNTRLSGNGLFGSFLVANRISGNLHPVEFLAL
jgi:hypothetical protein